MAGAGSADARKLAVTPIGDSLASTLIPQETTRRVIIVVVMIIRPRASSSAAGIGRRPYILHILGRVSTIGPKVPSRAHFRIVIQVVDQRELAGHGMLV